MSPSSGSSSPPISVAEIKDLAKARLQDQVWDFYETGADNEYTVKRNSAVYDELLLRPRVLRDVSNVSTSTSIFGEHYDIPFAIAPSAFQKLVGNGGEIDVARAAFNVGSNFTLSSYATITLEDVKESLPQRDPTLPSPWFQLYFIRDRDITLNLIQRAERAGYEALVLTVDTVVMGNRLHERKRPLKLPPGLSMANMTQTKSGIASKGRLVLNAKTAAEAKLVLRDHSAGLVDSGLGWSDAIPWLRSITSMKIIVKGVMTEEDALMAIEAGCDAIIVSNHGGRQLDGVSSTLEVLPEIVYAVKGKIPVMIDGGISKGSDIFKALALGADLCLIGRSALWGLAYNGREGVEEVMHILERELWRTMTLMGARSVREISRSMLGKRRAEGFGVWKL